MAGHLPTTSGNVHGSCSNLKDRRESRSQHALGCVLYPLTFYHSCRIIAQGSRSIVDDNAQGPLLPSVASEVCETEYREEFGNNATHTTRSS